MKTRKNEKRIVFVSQQQQQQQALLEEPTSHRWFWSFSVSYHARRHAYVLMYLNVDFMRSCNQDNIYIQLRRFFIRKWKTSLGYSTAKKKKDQHKSKAKQNQKIKISLWYDNDTTTIYTRLCMNEKNLCHLLLLLLLHNNNNNRRTQY